MGSFVVGKSCPAPVPCGPISRLTLSESGGLRGIMGLGCRSVGWLPCSAGYFMAHDPRLVPTRSLLFPGPILCEPNGTREKLGRSTGVLPTRTSCPVGCTKRTSFGLYLRGLSRGYRRSPSKGLRRRGVPFRGPAHRRAEARTPPRQPDRPLLHMHAKHGRTSRTSQGRTTKRGDPAKFRQAIQNVPFSSVVRAKRCPFFRRPL